MTWKRVVRHAPWLLPLMISVPCCILAGLSEEDSAPFPFQDPSLPLEKRVRDLVGRMTLEEKISQMVNHARAIPRLGVPEYDWWNECLHGVGRAGIATVFPQAIGLAATWDEDLMYRVATVISTEARAKHHEALRRNIRGTYFGLTFWSPNINIFRDPRWGRGQETYGEDPYLTSRLGVAFVTGLQGDHPRYLKTVSTPKHFAVHSGPEPLRHAFDARVDEKDLRETYLPAFEACVVEAKAYSLMGAYNRLNGEACCASHRLLAEILRMEWSFPGYVVSDCGAITDIYQHHKLVKTVEEAAALGVQAGCDLSCGEEYLSLAKAFQAGLISEAEIDRAVQRLFEARFRLGMFDPPAMVGYAQIPYAVNDSAPHRRLALEAARKSIVLLKNEQNLLPLKKNLKSVAVVGPNADVVDVLLGNYNGTPSKAVTPLEGIRKNLSPATRVLYSKGCEVARDDPRLLADALKKVKASEAAILVLGLTPNLEGEEMQVEVEGFRGGDRLTLDLPAAQERLLEAVQATGKPVVVVLLSGSALSVNWADAHVGAIVAGWYPGEEGGTALAEVLFGDYNPAGRLPVTFYKSVDQLPPFEDYRMEGRTYRYFRGEPLYPFGHGLSYTKFAYSNLAISPRPMQPDETLRVSVEVRNTGERAGEEVVQLYLAQPKDSARAPIRSLQGFSRIHLAPGASETVAFALTPKQLALVNEEGKRVLQAGTYRVEIGGKQPGFKGTADAATTEVVSGELEYRGEVRVLE